MNHMIDIFSTELASDYDEENNCIILYCKLPELPTPDSTGTIYAHITDGVQHKYLQLNLKPAQAVPVVPIEPESAETPVEPVVVSATIAKATLEGE